MNRGAWWATVHGVTKESDTTEHACARTHTHTHMHARAEGIEIVCKGNVEE